MKIGPLIENLLDISQKPKTDFALHMHMSPSGLSKIIVGTRLPLQKEKKAFCRQAASYFSEAVWKTNCYVELEALFPLIYNFTTKLELAQFIAQALEYSLDLEYAAENSENIDFPDREVCYVGIESTLNMLCIIVSNHVRQCHDHEKLDFYSTLPLFSNVSPDLFDRLRISGLSARPGLSYHQILDSNFLSSESSMIGLDFIYAVSNMQLYGDVTLWEADRKHFLTFLLIRGRCLMVFNTYLDGSPAMAVINHKSYLVNYYNAMMMRGMKQITFSGREALEIMKSDINFIDNLIKSGVKAVYSAISIGYMLDEKDLKNFNANATVKRKILKLFNHIMSSDAIFYVSIDAMMDFYRTGKLNVPLLGIVDIPQEERVPYLQRLSNYLIEPKKIQVLNTNMPKLTILHGFDFTIIYHTDSDFSFEKLSFIRSNAIYNGLNQEIESGRMKVLPFTDELWTTFLKGLHVPK